MKLAPKARARRSRTVGGLGRGLAGILNDDQKAGSPPGRGAGLLQLVGAEPGLREAAIRRFVLETALGAAADGFDADGLILVGGDRDGGGAASLTARLPPSWTADSPEIFEIYGTLWQLLDQGPGQSSVGDGFWHRQQTVGDGWVWLCRMQDGDDVLGAAAVRSTRFGDDEAAALAAVVGSVIGTMADCERPDLTGDGRAPSGTRLIEARIRDDGEGDDDVAAEVTVDGDRGRLTATGRAADPVTAMARAAANACRPRCAVLFAGSSDVEGGVATVVIVRADGGLRFGFAVGPHGDAAGPAAAVLSVVG